MLAVAVVAVLSRGDEEERTLQAATATGTPTPTIAAALTTLPTTTPERPTAAQPTRVPPLPNRTNCDEIRGIAYRSGAERQWFIANCIAATPTPPSAGSSPPAPPTQQPTEVCDEPTVTVTTEVDRAFYMATGTTVEEINASLQNSPLIGTKCVSQDSCSVGTQTVNLTATVTLPRLRPSDLNALSPGLRAAWDDFVARVSIHEDRHVTIAVEAASEIKRQLLLLAPRANCDDLDHQFDRVFRLVTEASLRRQDAFHRADLQGAGGTVVG